MERRLGSITNMPKELRKNPYKSEAEFRKMYEIAHSTLSCWDPDAWDKMNKDFDEWGVIGTPIEDPLMKVKGGRESKQ